MILSEWISTRVTQLEEFKLWYQENAKAAPAEYPTNLGEADWEEQFDFYLWSLEHE